MGLNIKKKVTTTTKPLPFEAVQNVVKERTPRLPSERGEHWLRLPLGRPPAVFSSDNATLLTIDPGINGTGWALWAGKNFFDLCPPIACGVIIPPRGEHWGQAAQSLFIDVHDVVLAKHGGHVEWIATEWPNFRNTAAGAAVAGSGDLGKLYFAASIPLCIAMWLNLDASCVMVNEWKGQLSKQLVEERIKKRLGTNACHQLGIRTHAWDAVGIGLYLKGHF